MVAKILLGVVGAGVVAAVVVSALQPSSRPSATSTAADVAVGARVALKPGYPGCKERSALIRIGDLAGDRVALARYMLDPANGCQILPAGGATVDDERSDLVKVRPAGDPTSYWTLEAAVTR